MRRLQGEETVQDDAHKLTKELNGESPSEASADTQLQPIDSLASQSGTGVPASPMFPVIDELDNEVEEVTSEQAVQGSDSDDLS